MARSNQPRLSRNSGHATGQRKADDSVSEHPANRAPRDFRCRLLQLEWKLRNKIFNLVVDEVEVVGLTYAKPERAYSLPLARTCKQIQKELRICLSEHALHNTQAYVVQVKDFDFEHLKTIIRYHPHFNHGFETVAQVKIYHFITNEDISMSLLTWDAFASQHARVKFRHAIGEVVEDIDKARFVKVVQALENGAGSDRQELGKIALLFKLWFGFPVGARERFSPPSRMKSDEEFQPPQTVMSGSGSGDDDVMSLDGDSDGNESEQNEENDPYAHLFDD